MNHSLNIGVTSRYLAEVYKRDTGQLVRSSGWSDNLYVASGLDNMLDDTNHTSAQTVRVGTGNTPPQMSDTGLQSPIGGNGYWQGAVENEYHTADSPYWVKRTARYRFLGETFGGNANITEVAAFTSGGIMMSRALIVDANGNPTAVPVQEDEFLDITREEYIVLPYASGTFNQMIDGEPVSYTWEAAPLQMSGAGFWGYGSVSGTIRPIQLSRLNTTTANFNGCIGKADASIAAVSASDMNGSNNGRFSSYSWLAPYVPGSFTRSFRINLPLNEGNNAAGLNGVRLVFSAAGAYQIAFDPPVPKTGTKIYYIDFAVTVSSVAVPE